MSAAGLPAQRLAPALDALATLLRAHPALPVPGTITGPGFAGRVLDHLPVTLTVQLHDLAELLDWVSALDVTELRVTRPRGGTCTGWCHLHGLADLHGHPMHVWAPADELGGSDLPDVTALATAELLVAVRVADGDLPGAPATVRAVPS